MATSTDVAAYAGVSRSTVSQIFNGHEKLFTPATVEKVRSAAEKLGYRPSLAGRSLVRGTSDIVITLVPDVTFNTRLRELVDTVTEGLAAAGLTNLLQIAGRGATLDDAILGLRPYGLLSLAPLAEAQRTRLLGQGVHIIEQSATLQAAIDRAIGRLQAEHLAAAGYDTLAVVLPRDAREETFGSPRESGARTYGEEHGLTVLPTLLVDLDQVAVTEAVKSLPPEPVGIATYNDEVAMAVLSAATAQGRQVPESLGLVGVDNSPIARATTPPITTVDYDMQFSGQEIVRTLLEEAAPIVDEAGEREVERRLSIVHGGTTRR
ncbi:LacI family DNA-binding transcriptional regulator [Brachybacterium massiliense]|uniref:LacI family DNA-binding transcriptional regulator n=1 Tax=Brachybacterium massiliense TaxID=1755098 RepID=UPI000B3BC36F|nr:LacI family DNA-binding transcriptional regulator [Brachybacterium massiliense]